MCAREKTCATAGTSPTTGSPSGTAHPVRFSGEIIFPRAREAIDWGPLTGKLGPPARWDPRATCICARGSGANSDRGGGRVRDVQDGLGDNQSLGLPHLSLFVSVWLFYLFYITFLFSSSLHPPRRPRAHICFRQTLHKENFLSALITHSQPLAPLPPSWRKKRLGGKQSSKIRPPLPASISWRMRNTVHQPSTRQDQTHIRVVRCSVFRGRKAS